MMAISRSGQWRERGHRPVRLWALGRPDRLVPPIIGQFVDEIDITRGLCQPEDGSPAPAIAHQIQASSSENIFLSFTQTKRAFHCKTSRRCIWGRERESITTPSVRPSICPSTIGPTVDMACVTQPWQSVKSRYNPSLRALLPQSF
ncbi:hypothetical protein J6590_039505 [Homalodisca vitripennis]|nr:hypothetical protein J6590_039505 [Homalodisca vitripennis]